MDIIHVFSQSSISPRDCSIRPSSEMIIRPRMLFSYTEKVMLIPILPGLNQILSIAIKIEKFEISLCFHNLSPVSAGFLEFKMYDTGIFSFTFSIKKS